MKPTVPPVPVEVSGSGSADHSASGEISGESGISGISGDASGSGQDVTFSGHTDIFSGDQSASGRPQEAEEGSTVLFISGELGSASGSGEVIDVQQSGFSASGSDFTSVSGDISGSGEDLVIIMVDGNMVEVSKTHQESIEQQLGQEDIESFESSVSGSGSVSASGSGGFSDISFIDHSGVDLTVQLSGEQEVSGYQPSGSGFHSGFPSGFPSGVSGSASASGDSLQEHGDIIFVTDDEMIEVTVQPLDHSPAAGRGVVEISGQGSGSGIHHDFSGTLDQSLHLSGSSASHEKLIAKKLSVVLPPGSTKTYAEYIASLGQSGLGEEEQHSNAGAALHVVTPDTAYTSPTTAPSVSLATPAVVVQPEVVEGSVNFSGPTPIQEHNSHCDAAPQMNCDKCVLMCMFCVCRSARLC